MSRYGVSVACLSALALSACAVAPPTGPEVAAMPGPGKNFTQFQQDDATCRQYAGGQTGGVAPAQAANQSAVTSAAVGTVIGAAAGAAIGAATGNPGAGAAIGAGAGLLTGGAAGANAAQISGASLQRRYDIAYTQCMAANGEKVQQNVAYAAGPAYAYPAPAYYYGPPGYYPPPGYYDPYWGPEVSFGFYGGRGGWRH
ncbi:MAG TPA: glycine zipper family protein [Stellaceae bacterium]|nr:glycine zipper family protein [Stellaceae bacterium]